MDPGNWIRFRIEHLEFVDVGPVKKDSEGATRKAPFSIIVSDQI